MDSTILLIVIPFIAGFLCLIIPRIKEVIAVIASLATLVFTGILFFHRPPDTIYFVFDNLSSFTLFAIGLFGILIVLYSLRFMAGKKRLGEYYAYILWTLGASCGAVLANNLILLLSFWGFLGFTLYLLIGIGGAQASASAKKTFIIIGGTDALMIMGIGIIWLLSGSFQMNSISFQLNSALTITAFVFIALACFAKAGAMPLHTWIPDSAETAPLPVVAFLPASLDKLLGIYLLARISISIFIVTPNSAMSIFLLVIGAVTVIAAVMMALIQHNAKKLLSYHAVSQVGYMVLGIGTGLPIGIAGGIFHMLNHAIYKCCLFLTVGSVEKRTGATELDKLGGLAKVMPVTFLCCLIAALSISGVPPFNGFVSKWMVYQGIIQLGDTGSKLWPIWLIAAMFGSALTLASFMKLIHAIFLGRGNGKLTAKVKEQGDVPWSMKTPMLVLAALCIIFGVFAYQIPLKYFIAPSVSGIDFTGIWNPGLATALIILGILIGLIIYYIGNMKNIRTDETPFYGGEYIPDSLRVTGTGFYNTIREIGVLKYIYGKAEQKVFDIYEQGAKAVFGFSGILSRLHNGVLPTYLAWCLLGIIILFLVLVR